MRSRPNVRKLMAWVAVAASGLGWWILARVQRDAVAAIERGGGHVAYGWDLLDTGLPNPGGRWWRPGWLIEAVGPDYFSTVRRASIEFNDSGPGVDFASVARLGGLKWLFILSPITDDALDRIAGLRGLRRLDLDGTHVGDGGLFRLRALAELRSLNLAGTPVTDAGLDLLASLPRLRSLDLSRTQVTEAGVLRLRALRPDLAVTY